MRLPLTLPLTLAFVILAVAACGGSGTATSAPSPSADLVAPTPAGSRPSSPAVLTFVSPTPNQVVTGTTLHVVLSLQNATIVPATTTNISPTTGHVHLYVDNALVSMNYQLSQDLPVHPGTYVMYAEFVAADHAPFDPRIKTPEIIFTVH
ncbi:MAG TPA: hypothetical protein VGJ17_07230 [Candidatus Limnocylindrales bacterium]|jgi:hypothetical protein